MLGVFVGGGAIGDPILWGASTTSSKVEGIADGKMREVVIDFGGIDSPLSDQPSARAPSPAASGAPSCIMVATTPQAGYEVEEEPEHPRPGSPKKRRIVLITRTHDQE